MATLKNKVALVTGGTSGIGERIVEVFIEQGARVAVAARRQEEGRALEGRIGASFICADVSVEADVKNLINEVVGRFGQIDCLVNNAGVSLPLTPIADIETADFDRIISVNVRGVFLCIKYAATVMIPRGVGSIINIASAAGLRGALSGHAYSASKGAVHALTRSVAAELGEKGIRVNSVTPGGIATGLFAKLAGVDASKAHLLTGAVNEVFANFQPVPRAGTTDDIALACVYLASDSSTFINGHDLVVDGGLTAVAGLAGWSRTVGFRADMMSRIKDAAAKL
jgi:NAD(P)-dependent dehydrogenase (short-subunit alcohol dehydrogenase family)